ncbi:MAG: TRM11 family SAM-dependent methyltransferase, partial [Pseudonocardiaceae bacterium]
MTLSIDVDRPVVESIHLESLPGVVDRLLQQCHDLGAPLMTNIRRVEDSVVMEYRGPLRAVAELRTYSVLSVVLGNYQEEREVDYAGAVARLRRSTEDGVLSALPGAGEPFNFRIDPLRDRWAVRDRVVEGLAWRNDPADWQLNLTRGGGLLLAQVGALYRSRRFPAMRRIPASTSPLIAAVLVQLLKARSGDLVYDPFCGAGTLLVELYALDPTLRLVGSDLSAAALTEATANRPLSPTAALLRADSSRFPLATDSVDRVISNIPFGKRVGSHVGNTRLYPAFLGELTRVLRADGRAVLLTEDKNLFRQSVQTTPELRIVRDVQLASGGLHPSAYVLERTRAARRSRGRGYGDQLA